MTNLNQPTTRAKQTIRRRSTLWQRLVAPPDAVTDIAQRRGVQLLASLLLFFIPLSVMGLFSVIFQSNTQISLAQWLNLVAFFISYIFSRTRYYKVSVVVLLMLLVSSPFLAIINNPARYDDNYQQILVWLVIPFLLASALLSLREMLIFIGLSSMAFILLPLILTELTFSDMLGSFGILGSTTMLIIVVMHHRNQIENDRQAELRESEERFRGLAETIAAATIIYQGTQIRYVNSATESLSGYKREELLGANLTQLLQPSQQVPARYELKLLTKNGEERWVDYTTSLIEFKGQAAILGTAFDITDRKRAEEGQQRLIAILEATTDFVAMADHSGRILYINQAGREMVGIGEKEQVSNMHLTDYYPKEINELVSREGIANAIRDGVWVAETTFLARDGKEIPTSQVLIAHQAHEESQVGYFSTIARNITERVQAEEQLKASLKEKEVLLKEIHHRVKNNLQIISSLLYLQSENIKDSATLEMFKDSQNRVKSMALIHEQLYQTDNLAKINLADYIECLTNHLSHSYGAHHISLQLNIEPLFLSIDTAIPCGLIINELVTNAMKYAFPVQQSPPKRASKIWIEIQPSDNHDLTLSVKDNGVGFPADINVHRPRSLGLTLVTTLVKQLKGSLQLQSENGTEFKIRFSNPSHQERSSNS